MKIALTIIGVIILLSMIPEYALHLILAGVGISMWLMLIKKMYE